MKIIYKSYMARPLKPFGEWDWEVREAVKTALALVEGKNGFKTHSEIWRRCNLVITVGHNIYTTSIEIRPPEQDVIRRRSNWHNGYAYYCNGVFFCSHSFTLSMLYSDVITAFFVWYLSEPKEKRYGNEIDK